jgi:HD-GYP domain-containing protein (c-di-GMP phosphodiesterase class II)
VEAAEPVRLADALAGLSRLADLGFGLPAGAALRSCVLATRLARSLDLPAADVQAAFYTALLHHVGCVGHAYETARLFGDEIAANVAAGRTDAASPTDVLRTFLPALVRGRPILERARLAFTAVTAGGRWGDEFTATACELGRESARRLDLPAAVQAALFRVYDLPPGEKRTGGPDVPIGSRIARLTGIAVLFESIGGTGLAVQAIRRRRGGMLDADLVPLFVDHAPAWLAELAESDPRGIVLALEPHPRVTAPGLRGAAEVFGDLADLKHPCFAGHARGVAALAVGAAELLRLPATTRNDLEVAGLLHDVGRVGVSSTAWGRPGRLTADEWEQVRLHPYLSERILSGSTALRPLAPLVGRHHERLDGSGYHRGCTAEEISVPARILAAADRYRTLVERRPHRAALAPDHARRRLLDDARRGTLDADAVHAVLGAAGHQEQVSPTRAPLGLSGREVQVLGLLAQGCGNAEIASRLVISRRTAEHHVQHIYTKIGVSSRAAATLFAVEHHLLGRDR